MTIELTRALIRPQMKTKRKKVPTLSVLRTLRDGIMTSQIAVNTQLNRKRAASRRSKVDMKMLLPLMCESFYSVR